MDEKWRDVEGYEGLYMISDLGNVYSCRSKRNLKPIYDRDGYATIHFQVNYESKTCKIHRLVAHAFIPNPDNKPQVNHINGIKDDNRVTNLEWVTSKENCNHAWDNALCINSVHKGERNGSAKLTDRDGQEVYDLAKHKIFKQAEIAAMYNISKGHVSNILHKRARKGVLSD